MPRPLLKVNRPTVSAESFDDEVIIIHFKNGNYYSLDAFGARAWEALEHGSDREQIIRHISARFQAEREKLARRLDTMLAELLAEDLIQETNGVPEEMPSSEALDTLVDLPEDAGKLLKFDDMQELLLLDPIHDVDDAGWPHSSTASEPGTDD